MYKAASLVRPLTFPNLLDRAVQLMRRHFRVMFVTIGLPLVLVETAASVLYAYYQAEALSGPSSAASPAASLVILGTCLVWILLVLGWAASCKLAMGLVRGAEARGGSAWRFAIEADVIWTLLLTCLCIVVSILLLVVPVIIVLPALSLVVPVMAVEGKRGGRALSRSWQLAQAPIGRILGLLIFGLFALWLLSMLVVVPAMIAGFVIWGEEAAAGESVLTPGLLLVDVALSLLVALVRAVVIIFMSFGLVLLYFDSTARRDAGDLEAAIDELAEGPGSGDPLGARP